MKTCTRCGERKPLEEFDRRRRGGETRRSQCRICRRAEQREWRETASGKASAERSRPAARARSRAWYWNNIERSKANVRAYEKLNQEKVRASKKRRYAVTREARKATMRANYRANRQAYFNRAAARRALIRGANSELIDRQQIFDRDHGVCGICGEVIESNDWHLDHIVPLAHGGSHRHDNVQVAHAECNLTKGATLPKEVV